MSPQLHRIATVTATALATAALAAPAGAEPSISDSQFAPTPTSVPRPVEVVVDGESGFQWGDAAIGAASTLALTLAGVGGVLAVGGRSKRREAPQIAR